MMKKIYIYIYISIENVLSHILCSLQRKWFSNISRVHLCVSAFVAVQLYFGCVLFGLYFNGHIFKSNTIQYFVSYQLLAEKKKNSN